jgi:hypothetical protein
VRAVNASVGRLPLEIIRSIAFIPAAIDHPVSKALAFSGPFTRSQANLPQPAGPRHRIPGTRMLQNHSLKFL